MFVSFEHSSDKSDSAGIYTGRVARSPNAEAIRDNPSGEPQYLQSIDRESFEKISCR